MPVYSISKEKLQDFLAKVIADSELIAPVKTDLVRFQKIGSPSVHPLPVPLLQSFAAPVRSLVRGRAKH